MSQRKAEVSQLQGTSAEGEREHAELPGDHVDRVREQWRQQRPDLDTTPLAVVARLGQVRSFMEQAMDREFARHGINRQGWDVLASLRRVGPPYRLSPTELYQGLMRTSGAMTHRLTILERAGLIRRAPAEADRRSVLVELTESGLRLVDDLAPEHLANERRLLAPLTPAEQGTLADLLTTLLRHYEREPGYQRIRRRSGGR